MLTELANHIEKIFDEFGNEIQFKKVEFKREKRKYSNTVSTILYIDDKACSGHEMKFFKVQYLCRCGRHITILLHKYMNKKRINCIHCLQDRKFEDSIKTYPYSLKNGIRTKESKKKELTWEDTSKEFKDNYIKNHLSEEEFFKYLPIIYKLNDIILNDIIRSNIKFKYYVKCNNQFKFTSKVSFDNGLTWETIKNVEIQCNICKKIFKIHYENLRKQDINNPKCKKCSFTNELFQIRLYKNTTLTYQSNVEKYFLDKCFENNINVLNGFEIQYFWNKKNRTYITDFYLPDLKIIVEIKAKNPFYYEDRLSGKIDAKNAYANNFAKENDMDFRFIFEEYIDKFINECIEKTNKLNYIIKCK